MKGYIVEIDPEIETSLSSVMTGVKWSNWKPVFLPETDSLMEKLQDQVETFLSMFEGDKISSRKLKRLMGKCDACSLYAGQLFSNVTLSLKKRII